MCEQNLKESLSGKFIVLDGPDGCGKSTQARLLVKWLTELGTEVETFREPGGTAIGEKIREILLNPEHVAMSTQTEVMLYMAARVQLWNEKIKTALESGSCVVLDRWLSSTCAYQGWAGNFGVDNIIKLATDCLDKSWPDLTIILDVDLETAAKRLDSQLDRMEQKSDGYHQKVRVGFLKLVQEIENFALVDAAEDIETVHKNILKIIKSVFNI